MKTHTQKASSYNIGIIKWLTFLMFMMFAMTTDAVGVIIPEVMKKFSLSMTAAGMMHYAPMVAIALAGILLGFLADRFGRKQTIILGLGLFAANAFLFLLGNSFSFYLSLMLISGISIGVFKSGALALIGDISKSTREHTSTMNAVEGFFGVGAIIGPFVVTYLLKSGVDWKWLYVIAGILCIVLIILALMVKYPETKKSTEEKINLSATLKMLKDPFALGFSVAAFLYVSVECAVYVWMPTLIKGYAGNAVLFAAYALPVFFILRAGGRFMGVWLLARFEWSVIMSIFSVLIFICFLGSVIGGVEFAVILLPLSGLFMSVVYPTINSKGISCFPKSKHGSVAGIILFFTAAGAALGPLSMGIVSDTFGHNAKTGFVLATGFAALLAIGFILNWVLKPTKSRLSKIDSLEYKSES
ncbi:MAG: MFS transporter [Paludibacter sp.]|nr:MFS transporter [Paludibacter sp.]